MQNDERCSLKLMIGAYGQFFKHKLDVTQYSEDIIKIDLMLVPLPHYLTLTVNHIQAWLKYNREVDAVYLHCM